MNKQIIRYTIAIVLSPLLTFPTFAQITIEPQNLLLPSGETAVFKVKENNEEVQYQWLKNGTPIAGATESVLTYDNVQLLDDGTQFQVSIKDGERTLTSDFWHRRWFFRHPTRWKTFRRCLVSNCVGW